MKCERVFTGQTFKGQIKSKLHIFYINYIFVCYRNFYSTQGFRIRDACFFIHRTTSIPKSIYVDGPANHYHFDPVHQILGETAMSGFYHR